MTSDLRRPRCQGWQMFCLRVKLGISHCLRCMMETQENRRFQVARLIVLETFWIQLLCINFAINPPIPPLLPLLPQTKMSE